MRLRNLLPAIGLALALSVLVSTLAAAHHDGAALSAALGAFAALILAVLVRINAPVWQKAAAPAASSGWVSDNAVLTAIAYAWGAAAMFTIYSLSGLAWRHWWQYGAGMALLGVGALVCAYLGRGLGSARTQSLTAVVAATVAQIIAIVVALGFLVLSGKLDTPKDDWAANHVFIAGGGTVLLISIVSLLTLRRASASSQPSA